MSDEYKEQTPQNTFWNSSEMAERWQQEAERRRQERAEATQRMLEAAGLKPGDRVLDVAAGTDISAEMLNIAARVAQQEELTNITTRVMDVEQLDLEDNAFDAVICRFGLMLIPHLQQALREIRRVLKPGGKLAALVWSSPENNPLFSLPFAVLSKYAREASSRLPNPFALSDPTVFERELSEAGFYEVITRTIQFQSHYASLDAFLQSSASRITLGVMGQLGHLEQQQMLEEVRQALSQFEGSHGLVAPGEVLLGVASK